MSELTVTERAIPELTDDRTVADLVDVLEHMRFAGGQATTLRLIAACASACCGC